MMKSRETDAVTLEVREARHRISERFGHDPRRLVAYYIEKQRARLEQAQAGAPVEDNANGATSPRQIPVP
jgi:hypothetical protein